MDRVCARFPRSPAAQLRPARPRAPRPASGTFPARRAGGRARWSAAAPAAATRRKAARCGRCCNGDSRRCSRDRFAERLIRIALSQQRLGLREQRQPCLRRGFCDPAADVLEPLAGLLLPAGASRRFHRVGQRRQCDHRIGIWPGGAVSASSRSAACSVLPMLRSMKPSVFSATADQEVRPVALAERERLLRVPAGVLARGPTRPRPWPCSPGARRARDRCRARAGTPPRRQRRRGRSC